MRIVNNIARLQTDILGLVALDQQIVEIEICHRAAIAPNLDMAQRSFRGGAAGSEDCIGQGA